MSAQKSMLSRNVCVAVRSGRFEILGVGLPFAGTTRPRRLMRILALDLGLKRIGLALSDPLGITAQGLPTLERKNIRADVAALKRLVNENGVTVILLGNPRHMSGGEGHGSERARDFGDLLSRETGCEIRYWDERLTTVEASRVLKESGISSKKRAGAVDRLSAVILLQSYMDSLPPSSLSNTSLDPATLD